MADTPLLLLLHGLGATGAVWDAVVADWPGEHLAPDLPGHGQAAPLAHYSFGTLAAAVAAQVPADRDVVVVGHSLGGVLALTLASGWFRVRVRAAVGLGIKVRWTEEELAKTAELATRPARVFATEEEAVDRHLKVSGLAGLVAADSAAARTGVVAVDGGWGLALDAGAFAVGAPDVPGLLAVAKCPVTLATGEQDPISPVAHLRELVAEPVVIPGAGHNPHVQAPGAVLELLG
ncbi:pimeloyl-ACP methyl ester carboxylesterase [Crossiella equi]|uniref:Pimeloyl-ACP methyl ester carboxylesterase n=1 Tax=Crossiella equi TaxID=130796 RepID=A0ABS5AQA9_9PSEU|nr:alpha/beta hydrolase [Crossiella equi]MBP2478751.1 pimeloyl-ACP methyl ester carboxylesterase [Crossiella equi]